MLPLLPGEMDLRSLQDCLFWLQAREVLGATVAPPCCVRDATTAAVAALNGRENLPGALALWDKTNTSLKFQV